MLKENEIRVLDILPENFADPIQARTRVVSVNDCVAYETLSYVWGDERELTKITVSTEEIVITKTLEAVLRYS